MPNFRKTPKKNLNAAAMRGLEISKVLVVSTACIHPFLIDRLGEVLGSTASETPYGWFVWSGSNGEPGEFNPLAGIPTAEFNREAWTRLTEAEFQKHVTALEEMKLMLCFAQRAGCRWILFDRDGEVPTSFPEYEH